MICFEFVFLYKPIVYGVARSLYGVATSDSVNDEHINVLLGIDLLFL